MTTRRAIRQRVIARLSAGACAMGLPIALAQTAVPPSPLQSTPPAPLATRSAPLDPEQMRRLMESSVQSSMKAMTAEIAPLTEATIEAQLSAAVRPDVAERLASFKKNLYDALLRKGFDARQALEIVARTGPPGGSSGR